jgi:hypothetical protein
MLFVFCFFSLYGYANKQAQCEISVIEVDSGELLYHESAQKMDLKETSGSDTTSYEGQLLIKDIKGTYYRVAYATLENDEVTLASFKKFDRQHL